MNFEPLEKKEEVPTLRKEYRFDITFAVQPLSNPFLPVMGFGKIEM